MRPKSREAGQKVPTDKRRLSTNAKGQRTEGHCQHVAQRSS